MRLTIAVVALALLASAPAGAQQRVAPSSHAAAAMELLEVTRVREQTAANIKTLYGGMAASHPPAARMAEVISQFMDEFMNWEVLEPEFVRIYLDLFTESELRELTAFYRTPLGSRLVENTPQLMNASMSTAQKLLMPHMPELQRRILTVMMDGNP